MEKPLRTVVFNPSALTGLAEAYDWDIEMADTASAGLQFILARNPEAGTKPYMNARLSMLAFEPKGKWLGGFVYYEFDDNTVTVHRIAMVRA